VGKFRSLLGGRGKVEKVRSAGEWELSSTPKKKPPLSEWTDSKKGLANVLWEQKNQTRLVGESVFPGWRLHKHANSASEKSGWGGKTMVKPKSENQIHRRTLALKTGPRTASTQESAPLKKQRRERGNLPPPSGKKNQEKRGRPRGGWCVTG